MTHSVLLDTSFFIRLLNEDDKLHHNALGYFKYFLEKDIVLKCSTISVAEYCVGGHFDELPWKNLQVLPFNVNHGMRAGEFARIVFTHKGRLQLDNRNIIPNDSKLFAQADSDKFVTHFVTSDQKSKNIYSILREYTNPLFEIIDINRPYHEMYGMIDFGT